MVNNIEHKETSRRNAGQYNRKNGLTILLLIAFGVVIFSPDAKSWVLRQLMVTGIFNAHIDNNNSEDNAATASGFNFQDENGNRANTASLKGKVVFINFWASWCPPCRAELPSIMSLYEQFKTNPHVYFLMISEDENLSSAKAFLKKEHYTLPLFKTEGTLPGTIFSGTLPTTVVLDKKGKIRYHHEGLANYGSKKFIKQIEDLVKE